jgi:Tol biopolymer transport system component
VIGANGKGLRRLTHSTLHHDVESPSWSPDGKWILYSHAGDDDVAVLQAVRPSGGAPRTVSPRPSPRTTRTGSRCGSYRSSSVESDSPI